MAGKTKTTSKAKTKPKAGLTKAQKVAIGAGAGFEMKKLKRYS